MKQYSAEQIFNFHATKKEDFWLREGKSRALALFHSAAKRVPAYKDFLRKHRVSAEKIRTFKDLEFVPPTDKASYLRKYPLSKLCWDGSLKKPLVLCATSGSTGEPFYFVRDERLDWQYSVYLESFLKEGLVHESRSKPILCIIGFGMGVWIGGIITYKAFELAAQRNFYPVSLLTPGSNKKEIFYALKKLAPSFGQIILCGYPPFIKDVIDEAPLHGIKLTDFNIRILFAAEKITEEFRAYIARHAGIRNMYRDIMNIYGTADLGTMAVENPTSILIRQLCARRKKISSAFFLASGKTATVAQYNPLFINFEAPDGAILITGDSALPLIRYAVGDQGGVCTFSEAVSKLASCGVDIFEEARRADMGDSIQRLPFVYVYERSDLSTKLYGAIIYPEHIRDALQEGVLQKYVTGKFTLTTKHDTKQNQFLEIHIELKPEVSESQRLKDQTLTLVTKHLLEKNAEYEYLTTMMPDRLVPKILFWEYEHPEYFKPGGKQKWVV